MPDMVKCEECGKEVNRRGLALHKTRVHRRLGGAKSKARRELRTPRRAPRTTRTDGKGGIAHGQVAAPLLPGVFGILAGENAALAQDLVAEAVRGGMPLGAACALIGRALSVPR